MQSHEVTDEVLQNEVGERQTMTFYTLPPILQSHTQTHTQYFTNTVKARLFFLFVWLLGWPFNFHIKPL